jgi:hypothetical protein
MSGGGRVVAIGAMQSRSCDYEGGHDVAVARIRWAAYGGGSALVCEQHLRLV